ncbi:MAG: WHG domain-containing protein [Spirochaetia bacterium]|jgi:AcrR family transcriptional regulator|nr:WHG domain-containing protein [Spirochaetia bacterium]
MHVTKAAVIQVASEIADKDGLKGVSLKNVAEKLHIRTPSLYNHIQGLDDLLRQVAHTGMKTMNERMAKAAIGTAGDAAIQSVGVAYLQFMIEHPGVYETIQWATWNGDKETAQIFDTYTSLLTTLILSCGFTKQNIEEILHLLMGVLHGYTTLRLGFALAEPEVAKTDLCNAIDTVLLGIHQKYQTRN